MCFELISCGYRTWVWIENQAEPQADGSYALRNENFHFCRVKMIWLAIIVHIVFGCLPDALLARRGFGFSFVQIQCWWNQVKKATNSKCLVARLNIKMGIHRAMQHVWWILMARKAFLIGWSESWLELAMFTFPIELPHVLARTSRFGTCWMGIGKNSVGTPKTRLQMRSLFCKQHQRRKNKRHLNYVPWLCAPPPPPPPPRPSLCCWHKKRFQKVVWDWFIMVLFAGRL